MRRLLVLFCLVLPYAPCAAELSAVPMQGAMVHINLGYSAASNRVTVHVDPSVPVLIPLTLSHPPDWFVAADPWYGDLDPAASGLAFNRQYGIVVDAATDPIPDGNGIWIRQVGADTGLRAHTYRSSGTNKVWTPMFGTDGSTNVLRWNFMMFHPAYSMTARVGSVSADYEAFLVDTNTGEEVTAVTPATFTLAWSTMGCDVRMGWSGDGGPEATWPTCLTNFALEHASTPTGSWSAVPGTPVASNDWYRHILDPEAQGPFFRLRRPPAP
jgi:hypothetical protein